jgi:aspartyl-tRNA(Asn)/glutamyl-tRNA(Gln) amidotransferase subunit B
LPKGYQISQFEIPVVIGGRLEVELEKEKNFIVDLERAHLEEDAGKSIHEGIDSLPKGCSGIDLNRAGIPLLEIVTEPCMSSSTQAVAYAKTLHRLVTWIDICDGNMQEGSFRIDANVSVRRNVTDKLGTRCEIKNLNSFRFLERAIQVEAERQIELIENGQTVIQQTRLFDPEADETRAMRSKEDANDYRYFPDPDLPKLVIENSWIDKISKEIPELPKTIKNKFVHELKLNHEVSEALVSKRSIAIFFEETLKIFCTRASIKPRTEEINDVNCKRAKSVANWMVGELFSNLNKEHIEITESKVKPNELATLLLKIEDGTLSNKTAKELFDILWNGNTNDIEEIISSNGLSQIKNNDELTGYIQKVIESNEKMVGEIKYGKDKALNSLVGKVMGASKGRANPKTVRELLIAKINSL